MGAEIVAFVSTLLVILLTTGYALYRLGVRKGYDEGMAFYNFRVYAEGIRYKSLTELQSYAEELQKQGFSADYPLVIYDTEDME